MKKNRHSAAFKVAINESCDYFSRLGGGGRYQGFEEWHCFALVAIVLKKISFDDVECAGFQISRDLWDGCDGLYQRVDKLLEGKEDLFWEYIREIDEHSEYRVRRHKTYEEYKGWSIFSWYLRNHIC